MIENQTPLTNQFDDEQFQGSEFDLKGILTACLRRKYGIIFLIISSLAFAWLYHQTESPEYHAVSILMINNTNTGNPLSTLLGTGGEGDDKAIKKDIELLQSMPITEVAVREMLKSSRRDSLEFFGKRKFQSNLNGFIKRLLPAKLPKEANQTTENLSVLSNTCIRQYVVKLSTLIRAQSVAETNILKVSVASPFPDEAVFLTNTLCRVYRDGDIQRNSAKYSQSNRFIDQMLRDQEKLVANADKALSEYMAEHEIYEVTGNVAQLLSKLTEIEAKYNDIQAEYHIEQNSLDFIEKKLTEADKDLSKSIAHNVQAKLGAILEEIRIRESEYVRLVSEKGADNVECKAKRQQLDVVKARYEQLSRSKIAGEIGYAGRSQKYSFDFISEKLQIERKLNLLNFSASEYTRLKKYYESQIKFLPKKQQEYAKLQREREVVGKTYLFLKEKLDESRILIGSEVGGVSIIGAAFSPFVPENASSSKNLIMGMVYGGLLAFLYVVIAEMLDDTIKDELFFKNYGFTILSIIPFIAQQDKKSFASTVDGEFLPLITDSLSSEFAESFRTLRTALNYCRVEGDVQTIIVSGTAVSEGKSNTCANLGIAFALHGKKTLIIDCDLRRASQHKIFNIPREQGLTDYLFSEYHKIDESFFKPTQSDNLFILTAGNKIPNPNEILGSNKMQELIKSLKGRFDRVLFDSPPLFLSDAAQLAHSVEGILLTAQLYYTDRTPLQEFASDSYLRSHILGITLIDPRKANRYGYGKYGYGKL